MKPFASWQEYEEHIKSTSCQDVNGDFVSLFNESIQRQHVWPFEGKKMRGVFSALQALVCNEVLTISMGKSAPQESYLEADFVVGIAFPPILCTPTDLLRS